MSLEELFAVIVDPSRTDMEKRLAFSVAYNKGVNDGLSLAKDKADEIRPSVKLFARPPCH